MAPSAGRLPGRATEWEHRRLERGLCCLSLELFRGPTEHVLTWSLAHTQILEHLQGQVLFKGRAGSGGSRTAEDHQLAQMMELFGPLPLDLLKARE